MLALNAAGKLAAVSSSSEPEVAIASCQDGQARSGRGQNPPSERRSNINNALPNLTLPILWENGDPCYGTPKIGEVTTPKPQAAL